MCQMNLRRNARGAGSLCIRHIAITTRAIRASRHVGAETLDIIEARSPQRIKRNLMHQSESISRPRRVRIARGGAGRAERVSRCRRWTRSVPGSPPGHHPVALPAPTCGGRSGDPQPGSWFVADPRGAARGWLGAGPPALIGLSGWGQRCRAHPVGR